VGRDGAGYKLILVLENRIIFGATLRQNGTTGKIKKKPVSQDGRFA